MSLSCKFDNKVGARPSLVRRGGGLPCGGETTHSAGGSPLAALATDWQRSGGGRLVDGRASSGTFPVVASRGHPLT